MKNEIEKIINWAAAQNNGHGAHIEAISDAIETVPEEVAAELMSTRAQWVAEHESRFRK